MQVFQLKISTRLDFLVFFRIMRKIIYAMHLIVDIRSRHPEDVGNHPLRAKTGRKNGKNIIRTILVLFWFFDQQEAPEWENFLRVKPVGWFSSSKKIASTNTNEIFRAINFSRYAPYDSSIPTLTFVMDMGRWLYDNETNANILRRKRARIRDQAPPQKFFPFYRAEFFCG